MLPPFFYAIAKNHENFHCELVCIMSAIKCWWCKTEAGCDGQTVEWMTWCDKAAICKDHRRLYSAGSRMKCGARLFEYLIDSDLIWCLRFQTAQLTRLKSLREKNLFEVCQCLTLFSIISVCGRINAENAKHTWQVESKLKVYKR